MKRIYNIISIFYILLWAVMILLNYKAYGFISFMFDTNVIKIHANFQANTGPMHYIDDIKGIKKMNEAYPGLDSYDIELVGDTPYGYVDDPADIGDLVVYGNFIGITNKYRPIGYDDVPVFKVKYYDYPSIILGTDLYILPIYIAVISLPILIAYLFILTVKKKHNKRYSTDIV